MPMNPMQYPGGAPSRNSNTRGGQNRYSSSGVPASGVIGAQDPNLRYTQANDPFAIQREQAQYAPDAYQIASQMLAGGQGAGGPGGQRGDRFLFTDPASQLNKVATGEHPGMTDTELRGILRSITEQGQQNRGNMAQQMSQFGGSVDPELYQRTARNIAGDELQAGTQARLGQIQQDRQALLQATQSLAPYMEAGSQFDLRQQGNLDALAGDIMGSGRWIMNRPGQNYTETYDTGGFGRY